MAFYKDYAYQKDYAYKKIEDGVVVEHFIEREQNRMFSVKQFQKAMKECRGLEKALHEMKHEVQTRNSMHLQYLDAVKRIEVVQCPSVHSLKDKNRIQKQRELALTEELIAEVSSVVDSFEW